MRFLKENILSKMIALLLAVDCLLLPCFSLSSVPTLVGFEMANASTSAVQAARRKFQDGDISSAQKDLSSLIQSKRVQGNNLEEAQKLLGVCQYLMGNVVGATASFEAVLKRNPRAKLNPRDVMDPSIQVLFAKIQSNTRSRGRSPGKVERPAAAVALRAKPAPQSPNGEMESKRGTRFTGIFVRVNAKDATVFSNGIFIGTNNQDISLDPGSHKISIAAQGFEEVTRAFEVKKGERLTLTVELLKEGERQRRAALAAAQARAVRMEKAREQARASADRRRQELLIKREEQKALAEQRALDRQIAMEEARARREALGLGAATQGNPAGGSLADEFYQDQSGGMYGAPPPAQGYGAYNQPQYAPPAYAPPPGQNPYGANPYGQGAYAAPPGYPPAQQVQPQYQAPQEVPNMYTSRDKKQPKRKPSSGKSVFLAILPFGAGQFQNGDVGLGLGFFVIDAGGIGMYFWGSTSAKKYKATAPILCEETKNQEEQCVPKTSFDAYLKQQSYISYGGIGLFATGWLFGAILGVSGMDDKVKSKADLGATNPKTEFAFEESQKNQQTTWSLSPKIGMEKPELGLGLKINF